MVLFRDIADPPLRVWRLARGVDTAGARVSRWPNLPPRPGHHGNGRAAGLAGAEPGGDGGRGYRRGSGGHPAGGVAPPALG
jgi:hypothetical protein